MGNGEHEDSADPPDDRHFKYYVVTKISDVVRTLLRVGGTVAIAYIAYLAIVPFAGQQSSADMRFLVELVAKVSADKWVAYLLGAGGLGYGLVERHLRKKYIEKFSPRIKELESEIDPGRSSSDLLVTGETRPSD